MAVMDDDTVDTSGLIGETTHKVLSAYCSSEQLKAAEGSWSEALWRELSNTGLAHALEPMGRGGLGIRVEDALNIVRIAGNYAAPVPLVENMLANWFCLSYGLGVAEGPMSVAPVNRDDRLILQCQGSSWRLTGTAARVPWARYAKALIVEAWCDNNRYIALVPDDGFEVNPGENMAREARDTVNFDAVLNGDVIVSENPGIKSLYWMGSALRVLQITGALDGVLSLTVEYARERKQFGRPISKFQAVQQNIAVMAANIAASRAAANTVVKIMAKGGSIHGLAAAKLRANEAATIAARLSHQVHGAMGFTQEYDLHFLTKRLWSWRDEFGTEVFWGRELGKQVFDCRADGLWNFVTTDMD